MSDTTFRSRRSSVKGKIPTTAQLSLGEIALNTNDGFIYLKTQDSSAVEGITVIREVLEDNLVIDPAGLVNASGTLLNTVLDELDTAISTAQGAADGDISTDATIDGNGKSTPLSISNTGVTAGTYGTSSLIPVITVNAKGQLDTVSTIAVAGVSSTDFDSANGTFTINTADGGSFSEVITLDPFTTTDLVEGSNLYYTDARADAAFDIRIATKTTTDLSEGSNLYYTTARADSDAKHAISVTDQGGDGSLSYNAGTGIISFTGASASETRAHFSGGTGVSITNGVVAIGQSVATTDDVTFGMVTADSADVSSINLASHATPPSNKFGTLWVDSDPQKGLSFIPTTEEGVQDVTINIGQEFLVYVHNSTGETIYNGTVVHVTGTSADNHPIITKSKADTSTTSKVDGMATMDIPNNGHGYITKFGLVHNLNTSGMTEGQQVYLSKDVAGAFTATEVEITDGFPFHIGKVLEVSSTTGSILVNPRTEAFGHLRIEENIIVDGNGKFSSVSTDCVDLTGTTPVHAEGRIYYDSAAGALSVYNDEADISLQVGQEDLIRVYNNTDSDIAVGVPVYLVGEQNTIPTIAPADAELQAKHAAVGFTSHTIETHTTGYVTVRGILSGIDTSGLTVGSNVHLAPGGGLQTAAPTYPYFVTDMGICLISNSTTGSLYVRPIDHTFESIRVLENATFDGSVTVGGNLTIVGSQSQLTISNLSTDNTFIYSNSGHTIGDNTVFVGTGLNDMDLDGHYEGTSSNKTFYVEVDGIDSTGDTFKWWTGTDSATPIATAITITNTNSVLADNISAAFNATTGHTIGDRWNGTASPINVDVGFASNRNTGTSGVGYTHVGMFFDVTDDKWKLFDQYYPEPEGIINVADSSYNTATLVANVEGNLTGDVTGNANTASMLLTSRTIAISGDITGNATAFDGTSDISISANITSDTIINADINSAAGIVDTKLATISTAGKVQNGATTATALNTASAIVARDASGNFTADTITATLNGTAGNADKLNNQSASYYRINIYDATGSLIN